MIANRTGDCIHTYSKTEFYPFDPRPGEVKLIDIAHALSMMCRFNGHCAHFYSVAQHSLFCMLEARARGLSFRLQLACLLHDACEAYVSDITSPVKRYLTGYKPVETKVQAAVWAAFGLGDLTAEEQGVIKTIDDAMLGYEGSALMGEGFYKSPHPALIRHDLSFQPMEIVRDRFVSEARMLLETL